MTLYCVNDFNFFSKQPSKNITFLRLNSAVRNHARPIINLQMPFTTSQSIFFVVVR